MQANTVHSGFRLGKQMHCTQDIFVSIGSKEKGENLSKPWVISKADLHFCVFSTGPLCRCVNGELEGRGGCLLYTSPSPRDFG